DTLSINGLFFSLKPEAVRKIPQVDFYINGFQNVVQSVLARIQINPNPSGTLMWIVMRDTDPYLASQSVNMLAEKFIQKSRDIRNEANRFQRQYIQEQLKMVQEELNRSDAQLRAFRDSHLVDLNQETQQTVNRLSAVDGYINSLTLQRKTLEELMSRVDPQSPNFNVEAGLSIHYIYQQIAAQPIFDGNAAMAIAKQEMAERTESLDRLRRSGLPPQNPTMREITERIQFIQDKILTMAREKLAEFEKLVSDQQTNASNLEAKLAKLPDEELRLIKLNRQRKANETLNELLLQQYKTAQITESVVSENISIIDPALPPQHPVTGSRRKKALLGAVFGVLLGLGATVIWEVMDRSIRNREDVNRFLHLPILGVIPKVKFNGYELQDSEKAKSISSQIVTHDYSPTPVGEAYRSFRTSLLFSKTLGSIRSLVIASVAPGEGKSFTSANLAITMAQQKSKALLIDADLRRGVLHNSFNCSKKPGLTNYLTGVVPLEGILNETYIPNLSLITCGSMIPNPSEILGSPRMQQFIEGITQRFDIVIFDTPPLLAASDAVVLGTLVDGICMIVMAGKTKRNEVLRKMELFQHVQAKVLGMVLNGAGVEVAHEGYSYYAY
ncbi:MAG TPA: polysaccharide biosynthesis tyrosine autokinase, partial [bacterium]